MTSRDVPRMSSPLDGLLTSAAEPLHLLPRRETPPLIVTDSPVRAPVMPENTNTVIFKLITFQGWLSQFESLQVREDFLRGSICNVENTPDMLRTLDCFRQIMLPSPAPFMAGQKAMDASAGVDFFSKLMAEEKTEPVNSMGFPYPVRHTYDFWTRYLGLLSSSTYWRTSILEKRELLRKPVPEASVRDRRRDGVGQAESNSFKCDRPTADDPLSANLLSKDPCIRDEPTSKCKLLGAWYREEDKWNYNSSTERPEPVSVPEAKMTGLEDRFYSLNVKSRNMQSGDQPLHDSYRPDDYNFRPVRECGRKENRYDVKDEVPRSNYRHGQRERRHEPRVRSRSYRRDSGESDDDDEPVALGERQLYKLFSSMRQPKEAVSPGRFSGEKGTSLREFLTDFDNYFSVKYDGNERQKSQLLGNHLEGPAKRAFEAVDGARMNYSLLKPELLSWYVGERTSLRRKSESEFRKARIMPSDSFKIFALRLERLAAIAFPESLADCERQLCRKFRQAVPDQFKRVLAEGERSLALHGNRKKLNWDGIVKLAESEDRHQRERREDMSSENETDDGVSVWYSRPTRTVFDSEESDHPGRPRKRVSFENNNRYQRFDSPPSRSVSSLRGSPFNRGGPSRGNGSPRDNVSPRGNSSPRENFSARGSPSFQVSSPPSRGRRVFSNQRRSPPVCDWCGKIGHVEDDCWMKSGACLSCGNPNHLRDDCPKNRDERTNFHPTCSYCKGPHLGKDCEQQRPSSSN